MAPASAPLRSLPVVLSAVLALIAAAMAYKGATEIAIICSLLVATLSAYSVLRKDRNSASEAPTTTAAEERVSALLNAVPLGAALFGADGRLLIENGRWREHLLPGLSGPIVGRNFDDLMRIAAKSAIEARGREDAWRAERSGEFASPKAKIRIPFDDGRIVQLDHQRRPQGEVLSIAMNSTASETVAASLDALRRQAESFLDNILDAVLIIDERGIVERVNRSAEVMFGLPRAAIVGRNVLALFEVGAGDAIAGLGRDPARLAGSLTEGQAKRPDGAFFPVEVALGEIASEWRLADRRAARRRGFVATMRDLTSKKDAEKQLRQAQKLEAVGTLAGGIAHDFNNLLAIVLGYANLSLADAPEEADELRESLGAIEAAAKRGKDLVRQLLTFSRGGGETRGPLDIVPLVKEATKLVRATLPPDVELVVSTETDAATVLGNATQIHQVLINLCTNAVQALTGRGGRIEVVVRRYDQRDAVGDESSTRSRPVVGISVLDDGPGIDAVILDRIFEPFFTTKDVGQGSGLGLAVAHGIARDHGGSLTVESAVGRGARFEARFPAHDGPVAAQVPIPVAIATSGHEHVLVVEYEPAIRHVIERHLKRLGYRVTAVSGSAEAFKLLQASPKNFDILLSDLSMPGMTGVALTEAIRAIGLDIPVIISTGGRKIELERAKAIGIVAQILKPNLIDEVGQVLRDALGAKS